MTKRKIEIQEPEFAQLVDLDENEKKPIWYRTGIWCSVAAIGGVAAAALYEIYRSSKESPAPAVDMFKGPTQPLVPHVEEPVVTELPVVEDKPVVKEVKKEEPKKEEPKAEPKKAPAKKAAPETDAKFVGNSDSLVYHTADCRYGKRISEQNKVFLKTKAAATKGGYKPCSYCNP